ncbi:MAG: ImmA/IrrE family metallo-endopeptidase [Candidatus Eisenbacteria sp.]|nr:ImmA/IrrE family metallo-endopeptidase [Candidatus Eisenbacteria bacterium]
MAKVIKNRSEYEAALREMETLVSSDPLPNTEDGARLELLALLISTYEDERFPVANPTAAEAIRFRMEQLGLTQRDLVPYIGSRSRVSEVLNGKRSLTMKMARALHRELRIPAGSLLQEVSSSLMGAEGPLEWSKFPTSVMIKRNWFPDFQGRPSDGAAHAEDLVAGLLRRARVPELQSAFLRQHVRSGSEMDRYALLAWWARAVELARVQRLSGVYRPGAIDDSFMTDLVRLSYLSDGPRLAKEYLSKHGIHLVILAHLPRTHLDGAAALLDDGAPAVILTLRYDRLDNFWFCLCHELGHIALHLREDKESRYFDDLDVQGDSSEVEADRFAERSLIPPRSWGRTAVRRQYSIQGVREYASRLRIHPGIIAGQIRREQNNYRILWSLVGNKEVRKHFPGFEAGVG